MNAGFADDGIVSINTDHLTVIDDGHPFGVQLVAGNPVNENGEAVKAVRGPKVLQMATFSTMSDTFSTRGPAAARYAAFSGFAN